MDVLEDGIIIGEITKNCNEYVFIPNGATIKHAYTMNAISKTLTQLND